MAPAENGSRTGVDIEFFKLINKGMEHMVSTDDIINSITNRTGIPILRASMEGVLKDYNVNTEFPEVLGAMIATVYGASTTAINDFSKDNDPFVTIRTDQYEIAIVSCGEDVIAAFLGDGKDFNENELRALALQIDEWNV